MIYLCGDAAARGTHVSLFLRIMSGPFDAMLKWPMQGKLQLELINQPNLEASVIESFSSSNQVSSNSFIRLKKYKEANVAVGAPKFIACKEMWHNGFVEDDEMLIR